MGDLRALLRDLWNLPDLFADRLDRWIQRVHGPQSIGDGGLPWCLHCKVRWPCPEFIKVHARWSARHPEVSR